MAKVKKTYSVFVDGNHGTTGIEITTRLKKILNLKLLTIPLNQRKNLVAKKKIYAKSDLVVLCLPDYAAEEAITLIKELEQNRLPIPKIIDTSTAFRTHPDWVYGHPQLFASQIRKAQFVANPGCYAMGFISLIYPLIDKKIITNKIKLSAFGISGYSGGGKSMIEHYHKVDEAPYLPYALNWNHKHIPEMQIICGLNSPPIFLPAVSNYYQGMIVSIPIPYDAYKRQIKKVPITEISKTFLATYQSFYQKKSIVKTSILKKSTLYLNKFLLPTVKHDYLEIFISTRDNGDVVLCTRLNNLGKGAASNAVENIKLMLGIKK